MAENTVQYPDKSEYIGNWNKEGQRDGHGYLKFPDGSTYKGEFRQGLYEGNGCLEFANGEKYLGQFKNGKPNGLGEFCRAEGMKFIGEFKDGQIFGSGLFTFADNSHGLPRNEGVFQNGTFIKQCKCGDIIERAKTYVELAKKF